MLEPGVRITHGAPPVRGAVAGKVGLALRRPPQAAEGLLPPAGGVPEACSSGLLL
jgi:hypothetical protein